MTLITKGLIGLLGVATLSTTGIFLVKKVVNKQNDDVSADKVSDQPASTLSQPLGYVQTSNSLQKK